MECALMVQPGDRLKVFTRGTDGEGQWKGRSGEWQQHRVERVEWRDDSGGPEAMLVGQGKQSWHHLVNLGAVAEREKGSGQSKCDRVCEQALQWMGQGSVVEVEWPVQRGSRLIGEWHRGTVIGREGVQQEGIMVRYTDGSVVAHTDLTERGCRVLSFRRWVSTWQLQQEAFWLRGEECPYGEEEANCECWWCNKEYWEPMYSAVGAGRHLRRELMAIGVAERLQWVRMLMWWNTWKRRASHTTESSAAEEAVQDTERDLRTTHRHREEGVVRPGAAKRIRIKKDGHCQFRAVAVHTQGGQQWWKQVRERAAEWVQTHWLVVAEDMAQRGVTLRSLLHRLQTDEVTVGTEHWGDENTALIIAWAYGRPLRVHNAEGADVVYLPDAVHEEGEIGVWYNGRNHYEAVRRATNAVQKNYLDSTLAIPKNKKRPLIDDPKITKKVIREHGAEHARSGEAGDRAGNEAGDRHELGQDARPTKARRSSEAEAQQSEASGDQSIGDLGLALRGGARGQAPTERHDDVVERMDVDRGDADEDRRGNGRPPRRHSEGDSRCATRQATMHEHGADMAGRKRGEVRGRASIESTEAGATASGKAGDDEAQRRDKRAVRDALAADALRQTGPRGRPRKRRGTGQEDRLAGDRDCVDGDSRVAHRGGDRGLRPASTGSAEQRTQLNRGGDAHDPRHGRGMGRDQESGGGNGGGCEVGRGGQKRVHCTGEGPESDHRSHQRRLCRTYKGTEPVTQDSSQGRESTAHIPDDLAVARMYALLPGELDECDARMRSRSSSPGPKECVTQHTREASRRGGPGARSKEGTGGPAPGAGGGARDDVRPGAASPQRPVGPARGHVDHRGAAHLDKARGGSVCIWAGRAEAISSHDQLPLAADGTDRNRQMHSGQVRGHIGEPTGGPAAHEQGGTGEQTMERRSSRRHHLGAAGRTVSAGEKERGGRRLGEGTSAGGHSGANETSGCAAARNQEEAPDRGRKRLRDETRVMAAAAPMDTREDSELSLTAIEQREDPHTQGPFGEPRTADDDRTREAATVKGSKQRKRTQHREDEGVG